MASSQIKFRSISLPSRLHPINSIDSEAELQKLGSCISRNSTITSETIQSGLLGLAELYNNLTDQHHHRQDVEDSLESSVQLLDSCNTVRELVQMIRENVQALQSALRRKGLNPTLQNDIYSYFVYRKKMNKCIAKSLKTLKNLENKNGSIIDQATIAVFKSALVYLSWPAGKSGGWNLVSRLMMAKSTGRDDGSVVSEVGCVDAILNTLRNGDVDVQMVKESLQKVDDYVEGIEEGLQILFKQLLQCRVTLLNIVTGN